MQHRSVPNTIARCRIGGIEQSLDFFTNEIRHQSRIGFLEWNCQNAMDLLKRCRMPILKEVEEGLDGCQPNIAGLRRIVTSVLQILQKSTDQPRVKLLKHQR